MALTPEQAKTLIGMVKACDQEMSCEECLAQIAEFVEAKLASKPLSQALQIVQAHLEACNCCEEEYRVLREAIMQLDQDD